MLPLSILLMSPGENRDFMEALYYRYHEMIVKTALYIAQNANMIDDIANDVYVRLIPKTDMLAKLDKRALTSYIVNTTRNTAIDALRKQKVSSKYLFFGNEEDAKDFIPDSVWLPEDILLNQERKEEVRKAFQMIPEKERFMLQFKYILDMSDSEIAKSFGISQDSVRVYLSRARRKAQYYLTGVATVEQQ